MIESVKGTIQKKLPALVLGILLFQPVLDVLSYFLGEMGSNALSTAVRFVMLAAVAFLGFLLSDRKKLYFLFYGIAGLFWVLHAANCFRVGYQSFAADTANFLRILNFPIFTLSFVTFFQKGEGMRKSICLGFAGAYGEILLFTALPWLIGRPVYTYRLLEIGVMGWFSVPSAQSAIIVLMVPLVLLWAYRTGKYPVFLVSAGLCFTLMFLTGTKLAFYSIFLVAGAFAFLFALRWEKRSLAYVLPLVAVMLAAFLLRGQSPMAERQRRSDTALNNYGALVEERLENSGVDEEIIQAVKGGFDAGNSTEARLEKVRRSLYGVYTDKEVYGTFLKNLHDRFGVYNVMAAYHYTTEPTILSDSRVRKTTFAKLMWSEKDFFTKLLGFEYSDMLAGGVVYDLENDFPAVFYFCGYLGFGLYLVFFGYLFLIILRAFFQDVADCVKQRKGKQGNPFVKGFGSFWEGVRRFLTVEMGAIGMTFLLATAAAQISANVLRRPNVTVYFAIAAAYMYHLTVDLRRKEKPLDLSGGF